MHIQRGKGSQRGVGLGWVKASLGRQPPKVCAAFPLRLNHLPD